MNVVEHFELPELVARFKDRQFHLLVSASYEERAFSIWERLHSIGSGRRLVCFNANHTDYLEASVERFQKTNSSLELVHLDSDQPLRTFEALRSVIEGLRVSGVCTLVVDLTGFTREALAILLYLARQRLSSGSTVIAMYHKAGNYGRSKTGGWLSQGVREVRSVLGYAGLVRLAAETHLILLAGFEFERAHEIIDAVQPNRISLGDVRSEESISDAFHEALSAFLARSEAFYSRTAFDRIRFSSIDPFITRDLIVERAKQSSGNVVVACLNTKPAMVGACLAAIEQPTIQLIYAQPVSYNVGGYSSPSGKGLSFDLPI